MNILLTGGAGFIGSHIVGQYVREGDRVSVIDDLSTGKRKQVHRRLRNLMRIPRGRLGRNGEVFSAAEAPAVLASA